MSRMSANLEDMGITNEGEERASQGSFCKISYQSMMNMLCRGGSKERN